MTKLEVQRLKKNFFKKLSELYNISLKVYRFIVVGSIKYLNLILFAFDFTKVSKALPFNIVFGFRKTNGLSP